LKNHLLITSVNVSGVRVRATILFVQSGLSALAHKNSTLKVLMAGNTLSLSQFVEAVFLSGAMIFHL